MERPPLDELLSLMQATVAAEGVTTAPGAAAGNSIVDAGLAGAGANSFFSMLMVVYPGQPRLVDSMDITAFNNANGEVTLSTAYKGVAAPIPAGVPYKIITFRFVPAEVAAIEAKLDLPAADAVLNTRIAEIIGNKTDTAIVAADNVSSIMRYLKGLIAQTSKLPNFQHEVEWASTPVSQQVASAALTDLTAGSITPTFPTGATRVRAILVASIHAANQAANTHHIGFTVQGQKDAGGYVTQVDLTAVAPLGLVNLDGAGDGWSGAIDVTTLVDASGSVYTFRFQVDSDNAGAVNYTTNFVLVLVYRI